MGKLFDVDLVSITEKAAIEASKWTGKGDARSAFIAAHDVIYRELENLPIKGKIVLTTCNSYSNYCKSSYSHGEFINYDKDYPEYEFAISPLECINSVAYGRWNALSIIAIAAPGTFIELNEKIYMDKLIVGKEAKGKIDLNQSVMANLNAIADSMGKKTKDLLIAVLDRPRNNELISKIRACGAKASLLLDGDLEAGVATNDNKSDIDVLMGSGGAIEGIITAAIVKVMGGDMQGRFIFRRDEQHKMPANLLKYKNQILTLDDMVRSDLLKLTITGVTDGNILSGISINNDTARVQSVEINSEIGSVRFILSYDSMN